MGSITIIVEGGFAPISRKTFTTSPSCSHVELVGQVTDFLSQEVLPCANAFETMGCPRKPTIRKPRSISWGSTKIKRHWAIIRGDNPVIVIEFSASTSGKLRRLRGWLNRVIRYMEYLERRPQ